MVLVPVLDYNKYYVIGLVAQWSSALAAMAMLSARTWVQIPPTASGVFACNKVNNGTPTLTSVLCGTISSSIPTIRGACKTSKKKSVDQKVISH